MIIKEAIGGTAPVVGPAIITLFGLNIPVLAFILSIAGLLLARFIAPSPVRKLSKKQELALTLLLCILLLLIVSGSFGGGKMGEGMAVVWGIGLGFSGLIVIETIGIRVLAALQALFYGKAQTDDKP
jgi:hypothetical protein